MLCIMVNIKIINPFLLIRSRLSYDIELMTSAVKVKQLVNLAKGGNT
jgi:hypothetical protein